MKQVRIIEEGIYDIPIILPESLEPRRNSLHSALMNAQRRLRNFAYHNGWGQFVKESFAKRAEIYDDQRRFVQTLLKRTHTDPSIELPSSVSAALEEDILMSVSPETYRRIYPEGIEEKSFEKLIAHEMAHRLHIRILGEDEDAMGPVWFIDWLRENDR